MIIPFESVLFGIVSFSNLGVVIVIEFWVIIKSDANVVYMSGV